MVLSMGAAFAATPGSASITSTDRGSYDNASTETLAATGGTIFDADVTTTASTIRWVGISGDVSGNIVLGDSSNNILYNWGDATPLAVYATLNGDTINWDGGLSNGVQTDFETDFSYLTDANAPNDGYTKTFNASTVDLGAISNLYNPGACPSAETLSSTGAAWQTLHCQDGSAQTVLVGIVDATGHTDYSGTSVNYQMIIPELGGQGETGATLWDLWVELE